MFTWEFLSLRNVVLLGDSSIECFRPDHIQNPVHIVLDQQGLVEANRDTNKRKKEEYKMETIFTEN